MTESLIDVLGSYPTGVVIVTAIGSDGEPVGLLARTFSPVSPEPAVVSFTADPCSAAFDRLRSADSFCLNLIAEDGEALCREFVAAEENGTDAFASVPFRLSPTGAPILDGVLSWIECLPLDIITVGPRSIVLGEVQGFSAEREFLPLLSFQQGYGRFRPGPLVVSRTAGLDVTELVKASRDPIDLLSRELGAECSLLVADKGDLVFVATSNHSNRSNPTRLGLRAPLVPPIGALFVDSDGAPSAAEWIEQLGSDVEQIGLARTQLDQVRRRGWSISLNSAHSVDELDAMILDYTAASLEGTSDAQRRPDLLRQRSHDHDLVEIVHDQTYSVLQVSVPVLGPNQTLACVLRLSDLPPRALGSEVTFWVDQLRETALTVQYALGRSLATN